MNKYDQSFLNWFEKHGWQIHDYLGDIKVWTNGDAVCPFKVTSGMINRLIAARKIEQTWPDFACVWDKFYILLR